MNMHAMIGKTQRRHLILELIQKNRVHNQDQLKKMLHESGVRTTQATLSRDLRDLGVSKGSSGYMLPGIPPAPRRGGEELEHTMRTYLLSADRGGNMIVLHTPPGFAQALAVALDNAQLRGVLGTIAGDDTVLVVAKSAAQAGALVHIFKQLAGHL